MHIISFPAKKYNRLVDRLLTGLVERVRPGLKTS
jgi:hypothetical protein